MSLYPFALFMHIVGALGMFAALGLEWMSVLNLRRAATAEEVQLWSRGTAVVRRLGPASLVTILVAGVYLTITSWGMTPWILVTLASLLLFPVLGALSGMRLAMAGRSAAGAHGVLSASVRQQLQQPILLASIQARTAIALGIVFLMTVKPGLSGSLLAIGVATALGLAPSLPAWNRARATDPATQ